jgi:hypothetical protein
MTAETKLKMVLCYIFCLVGYGETCGAVGNVCYSKVSKMLIAATTKESY